MLFKTTASHFPFSIPPADYAAVRDRVAEILRTTPPPAVSLVTFPLLISPDAPAAVKWVTAEWVSVHGTTQAPLPLIGSHPGTVLSSAKSQLITQVGAREVDWKEVCIDLAPYEKSAI